MKRNLLGFVYLLAATWLVVGLAGSVLAQRPGYEPARQPSTGAASSSTSQTSTTTGIEGAKKAKAISKEEALKNYPPPKSGSYPMGERDPHKSSGLVYSPYPPRTLLDCSEVPNGSLAIDPRTNRVFVRP